MSDDKLTEALAWFKRTTGLDGDRSPFQGSKIEWVAQAAERWASFPTDDDVRAGVIGMVEWQTKQGADLDNADWSDEGLVRAALEAVK